MSHRIVLDSRRSGSCSRWGRHRKPWQRYTGRFCRNVACLVGTCHLQNNIIIGDFNSHNHLWGYRDDDENGLFLEEWISTNNLHLTHDSKLPNTFNSGRWKRGYNPDLACVSQNIRDICHRRVYDHIPRSQHRPHGVAINPTITPSEQPFRRRYNFKKANWETVTTTLDNGITSLASPPWKAYKSFSDLVRVCARKCIPRGCRTKYISGLTPESGELLKHYQELYDADPFSADTIEAGANLNDHIKETRKQKWEEMITGIDLTHNSKKWWQTLAKINGDDRKPISVPNITPDAIAHQLLLIGKPDQNCKIRNKKAVLKTDSRETILTPFTIQDLGDAISLLKDGKAPGLDNIHHKMIKCFGPTTRLWLLDMLNDCLKQQQIPNEWRKAKVVALLKPGKYPESPKSYRPIALLCSLYSRVKLWTNDTWTPKKLQESVLWCFLALLYLEKNISKVDTNRRTRKCFKVTLKRCYIQQLKSFIAKHILPIVNPELFTIARFFWIEMHSHRLLEYFELCWHTKSWATFFIS